MHDTTPSRTLCRFSVNSLDSRTYLCSAWFVTPKHLVTAGHCISYLKNGETGSGIYDVNPANPGYVCCHFLPVRPGIDASSQPRCRKPWMWNVTKWVTTAGYFNSELEANDGAVIEVVPADPRPNMTVAAIPQRLMAYDPLKPIPRHRAYLDGYPGQAAFDSGCSSMNTTQRYFTEASLEPNLGTGILGLPAEYPLSGCVGQSGGRVALERFNGSSSSNSNGIAG
ncbi:hypothetical protein OEZ86_004025 [Tetradesmus obliquus]|nr:hypothetical protein OEZ86_004025 [Tetradesmus obliquus]